MTSINKSKRTNEFQELKNIYHTNSSVNALMQILNENPIPEEIDVQIEEINKDLSLSFKGFMEKFNIENNGFYKDGENPGLIKKKELEEKKKELEMKKKFIEKKSQQVKRIVKKPFDYDKTVSIEHNMNNDYNIIDNKDDITIIAKNGTSITNHEKLLFSPEKNRWIKFEWDYFYLVDRDGKKFFKWATPLNKKEEKTYNIWDIMKFYKQNHSSVILLHPYDKNHKYLWYYEIINAITGDKKQLDTESASIDWERIKYFDSTGEEKYMDI